MDGDRVRTAFTGAMIASLVLATSFAGPALQAAFAQPAPACDGGAGGGDWPSYGRDLTNQRNQTAEDRIGPGNVSSLTPKWAFSSVGAGGDGGFQSTPVVSGGCVFAGTTEGWMFAVDAASGRAVWKRNLGAGGPIGGIFAVAAAGNRVYVNVSAAKGPYVTALDRDTGRVAWKTATLRHQPGSYTNASAVVYRGLIFVGTSGTEGDPSVRGLYAVIDAGNGRILATRWVISDRDFRRGQAGADIWSTAAVDTATGYLYVGTGNPYGKEREHRYANAILKIDLDRTRSTFADIVGFHHGEPDQYVRELEALRRTPVCQVPNPPLIVDNPHCGQLDLDFGASPNLFRGAHGRLMVGELQKSGVYHVVDARTMKPVWKTVVGGPCADCNGATPAVDTSSVYVVGTPPSTLFGLNRNTGEIRWATPIADDFHYQAVTTANGVVYTMDSSGRLDAYDAGSGAPLLSRPLSADTAPGGGPCDALGGSVSVAMHHVYAACDVGGPQGGWIVAYGLPAGM